MIWSGNMDEERWNDEDETWRGKEKWYEGKNMGGGGWNDKVKTRNPEHSQNCPPWELNNMKGKKGGGNTAGTVEILPSIWRQYFVFYVILTHNK